jgi:hypothetical protein
VPHPQVQQILGASLVANGAALSLKADAEEALRKLVAATAWDRKEAVEVLRTLFRFGANIKERGESSACTTTIRTGERVLSLVEELRALVRSSGRRAREAHSETVRRFVQFQGAATDAFAMAKRTRAPRPADSLSPIAVRIVRRGPR